MFKDLPSRQYLRQLKRYGVYAWSELALRSMIVVGVAVAILAGASRVAELSRAYDGLVAGGGNRAAYIDVLAPGGQALNGLGGLVGLLSCLVLVFAVLGCLIQTRGAIGFAVLRSSRTRARRFHILRFILGFVVVVCLSYASFRWLGRDLLGAVRITEGGQLSAFYLALLTRLCKLVVVAASVLAILLVFVSRIRFLFQLRGSKRELSGRGEDISVPRVR
jgi:flagellar biosynthesis protein FlhB